MTPYDSTPAQAAGEEGEVSISSNVEEVKPLSARVRYLVWNMGKTMDELHHDPQGCPSEMLEQVAKELEANGK